MTAHDAIHVAGSQPNMMVLQYKLTDGRMIHRPVMNQHAVAWLNRLALSDTVEFCSVIDRDELRNYLF